MSFQIFGRTDCQDSRKAQRWFQERRIPFHFVDLKIKGLSPRELETVAQAVGWEKMLDRESKRFLAKGLAFMTPARIPKLLLEDSLLLKTPIVRKGPKATIGMHPEIWEGWK